MRSTSFGPVRALGKQSLRRGPIATSGPSLRLLVSRVTDTGFHTVSVTLLPWTFYKKAYHLRKSQSYSGTLRSRRQSGITRHGFRAAKTAWTRLSWGRGPNALNKALVTRLIFFAGLQLSIP